VEKDRTEKLAKGRKGLKVEHVEIWNLIGLKFICYTHIESRKKIYFIQGITH
jgi:hypothetical protein